ncbi:glycosyltransferase family 2 protein [Dyadobacter sandarakinus]|uniref:Glycosyltransferase n=1 Tax=Dyadobacter sandarakinus TaxID=2747268 RepID=A0ABX7I876_9BACT|nr:glycosyltransferase family 2 protein [Dyadobacter sandarakinus]QRR01933.1 glycosyltransferase [Dyadobacter sandarakinus]
MTEPLLTIVTITYNAEKYIERTLESVSKAVNRLEGGLRPEYLVIDGNSRDATLAIAGRYRNIVSGILSEPDKGIYDAMNKGLAAAKGKYIWFLNAGDEIAADMVLPDLYAAFETDADIFYSDAMLVREDGSEFGLRSRFTPHSLPKQLRWQDFALGMKVCHQAFIVKTSLAPTYDITNLSADIDWEITCLKRATSVHYLPFTLCCYLMGGASIQNHRRSLTDRFKVLTKHFGLVPSLFNHLRIFWRGFIFTRKNGKYW